MKEIMKTIVNGVKNAVMNPVRSRKMMKATVMWQKAKEEAEEKRKMDGHRYFVIYDAGQKKLISITYDIYRERGDSYKYLRLRGRFKKPLKREELKALCFYYTTSQWTTKPISQEEEREKLVEWQKYYMKVG
jgi:hypothetical protein